MRLLYAASLRIPVPYRIWQHPERFLSKDELDDYRASLSYYNSQYLELLAMLNTEQSVLFKKLQDNRSDIIGLERDASFRCGLCVGLKLGSLSSLLLSSMRRAKQCRYFASSLPPNYRHSRLTIVRRGCWMCRNVGIHGEAMYTAPDYPQGVCHIRKAAELPTAVQCAACAVIQAANPQCAGSRGKAPCVLLGVQGGHSLT